MNKYQRGLSNKMNDIIAQLQSDWEMKAFAHSNKVGLRIKERINLETELNYLREKLAESYK